MKLSEAIEKCLLAGYYEDAGYYMCHALENNGMKDHVRAVGKMVKSICPYSVSLAGALGHAEIIDTRLIDVNEYTTEFYCWWVFDLKRKGL